MDNKLTVRIISPKEIIFQGQADSVSSKNSAGKFDILPLHANFISFIENQPIDIRLKGQKDVNFKFPFAIVYNHENKVDIFTDIATTKI